MGKAKVRFDGLDVAAMVAHCQRELLGRRVINIYDGVSENDSFLIKLDAGGASSAGGGDGQSNNAKKMLFLESGIRFHTTDHASLLQQEGGMPSPFCSKLRKHLRGLRLERVVQLGNYDRVVNLVFGSGEKRHSLILELYARGNLLLTNAAYSVLALLRSHEYDDVKVQVGHVYPVTHATSLGGAEEGIVGKAKDECVEWVQSELSKTASNNKKKTPPVLPLKAILLKPTSGVYQFGPSLIEHCIMHAKMNPNVKVSTDNPGNDIDWENLSRILVEEGARVIQRLETQELTGFILYSMKAHGSNGEEKPNHIGGQHAKHSDKVLEDFQPHILLQHIGREHLDYPSFASAVDEYFANLGTQKRSLRAEAAENAAKERLQKIRQDQQQRIQDLQMEQERLQEHAQLVEVHAQDVDKALSVINSALDSGMDWEALEQLVRVEQEQNRNPVALMIHKLDLENDALILTLPSFNSDDNAEPVRVQVSLGETAHANARSMFAQYRAFKEKSKRTLENATKAMKAAEANAQKQLHEAQQRAKISVTPQISRKPHWFEKFHWFITGENYLVLGGKDAHQNEMLVKRYLRQGDAYLHADVHGAASCVLRAKRRRNKRTGKTEALPLSEQALREAGNFTICRSSAWSSRMVTSAWWVESHQVSKTAPTGEYLTVGSFMVRGKKNFLPPSQLEMGIAVLFRLGDDDSIARHKNERRDFALLSMEEEDTFDKELPDAYESFASAKATAVSESDDAGLARERQVEVTLSEPPRQNEAEMEESNPKEEGVIDDGIEALDEAKEADSVPVKDLKSTPMEEMEEPKKRKGLSAKDRKLIKKYGSLEAAWKAAEDRAQRENQSVRGEESSVVSSVNEVSSVGTNETIKRGKRGKMRKAARKYADQDDEDRELALLALHGGENKQRNKNANKRGQEIRTENQEKAATDAVALLVRNSSEIAEQLSEEVKRILAECVTVYSDCDELAVRWDKVDADVLEQLMELNLEQQVAAVKRLQVLKQTTRIDNFSASLSGIVRTIRKYGHENLDVSLNGDNEGKRKTKAEKEVEQEAWRATLAEEGIVEDNGEETAVDDTAEISKLTGKPASEDSILYAVPVCAPYQTLAQYKYRVKLTPGGLKRGKAAKQCLELLLEDKEKTPDRERNRSMIKSISDNEWVQSLCADVKISAAGMSKFSKKQKGSGGKNGGRGGGKKGKKR